MDEARENRITDDYAENSGLTPAKGSIAHQIDMAVVRAKLRAAVIPAAEDDGGVDGSHRFTCDNCHGSGREWEGWPCEECAGEGYLDV